MSYTAIDVGGTFIKYADLDRNGVILNSGIINTPYQTKEAFIDTLCQLVAPSCQGVCLSLPGFIDADNGICVAPGPLSYLPSGYPIKQELEALLGYPVTIENDARCAALAEMWKGSIQGKRNALVLVLGTGMGAACILEGKLYKGSHNIAGEVGYALLHPNKTDIMDVWGMNYSIGGLCRRFCKQMQLDTIDGKGIMSLCESHDPEAETFLNQYVEDLACAVFDFQTLLDVECVAIGGGISQNQHFMNLLELALNKLYKRVKFPLHKPLLVPCRFHNEANLIGAFYRHVYL